MPLWADEEFGGAFRIGLKIRNVHFDEQSEFQRVTVVESEVLGNALLLDHTWMTAEHDEKSYHEMLVHPAMTTASSTRRVLVIGGGDGGTVREVLRYPDVESVTMVEIDPMVVEASKRFLPTVGTAWDDPRLEVRFEDGIEFVKRAAPDSYDVILVDGSDPVGPAAVLFTESFFASCRRALREDGVFAAQAEGTNLPVLREQHIAMVREIAGVFDFVAPYYGSTVLYPGGNWSWVYATDGQSRPSEVDLGRIEAIEAVTEIYNREIHHAAFAVPNHVRRALAEVLPRR